MKIAELRLLTLAVILASLQNGVAQHHLGLSVHYGDRLTFSPSLHGFFRPRKSFSPTLAYIYQQQVRSNFSLAWGAQVGVAGYQLVPIQRDTLGPAGNSYPFVEYGTFVARLEVVPGTRIRLGARNLVLGLGEELVTTTYFFPTLRWMFWW